MPERQRQKETGLGMWYGVSPYTEPLRQDLARHWGAETEELPEQKGCYLE